MHGVVIAAALKAIAAYKQVGARGEHYGSVVLFQCRNRLQPPLPDSTIGKQRDPKTQLRIVLHMKRSSLLKNLFPFKVYGYRNHAIVLRSSLS